MKGLYLLIFLSFQAVAIDFDEKYYEQPVREVSVIVTETGFFPIK